MATYTSDTYNYFNEAGRKGGILPKRVLDDMSYYSIFNGRKQETVSFGESANGISQIYLNYAKEEEKRFLKEHRTTAEEFLKESQIAQQVFEGNKELIASMQKDTENLSSRRKSLIKSVSDLRKLQEDAPKKQEYVDKMIRALKDWERASQGFLDNMAQVDTSFAESAKDKYEIKIAKNIPSGEPIGGLRLDAKAFTSHENAQAGLKELRKQVENVEKVKGTEPPLKLTVPKYSSAKGTFGQIQDKTQTIEKFTTSINGSISSVKGTVFEIEVGNALSHATDTILKEIQMLGNAKGVTVDGVQFSTSKTDVQAKSKKYSENINLSVKNQTYNGPVAKSTALFTGSLYKVIKMVSETERGAMALSSMLIYEKSVGNSTSKLNRFLKALTADFALASGQGDRIDFMVYSNEIIPTSVYLKDLESKLSMSMVVKKENKYKIRTNIRKVLTGEMGYDEFGSKGSGSISYKSKV